MESNPDRAVSLAKRLARENLILLNNCSFGDVLTLYAVLETRVIPIRGRVIAIFSIQEKSADKRIMILLRSSHPTEPNLPQVVAFSPITGSVNYYTLN